MVKINKILLAEDDSFISLAYKDGLTRSGFDVILANDGLEVLKILKEKKKPNLILLDLIMPNKNGFEVLEDLQKSKTLKKIPVIVLSNLGQKSDIDRCQKLGAVDYLVKSEISMKEVIEKIKKYLKVK